MAGRFGPSAPTASVRSRCSMATCCSLVSFLVLLEAVGVGSCWWEWWEGHCLIWWGTADGSGGRGTISSGGVLLMVVVGGALSHLVGCCW